MTYEDDEYKKGYFALQCHNPGMVIEAKDLYYRDLSKLDIILNQNLNYKNFPARRGGVAEVCLPILPYLNIIPDEDGVVDVLKKRSLLVCSSFFMR